MSADVSEAWSSARTSEVDCWQTIGSRWRYTGRVWSQLQWSCSLSLPNHTNRFTRSVNHITFFLLTFTCSVVLATVICANYALLLAHLFLSLLLSIVSLPPGLTTVHSSLMLEIRKGRKLHKTHTHVARKPVPGCML